jgi:hypothetical protein
MIEDIPLHPQEMVVTGCKIGSGVSTVDGSPCNNPTGCTTPGSS